VIQEDTRTLLAFVQDFNLVDLDALQQGLYVAQGSPARSKKKPKTSLLEDLMMKR